MELDTIGAWLPAVKKLQKAPGTQKRLFGFRKGVAKTGGRALKAAGPGIAKFTFRKRSGALKAAKTKKPKAPKKRPFRDFLRRVKEKVKQKFTQAKEKRAAKKAGGGSKSPFRGKMAALKREKKPLLGGTSSKSKSKNPFRAVVSALKGKKRAAAVAA